MSRPPKHPQEDAPAPRPEGWSHGPPGDGPEPAAEQAAVRLPQQGAARPSAPARAVGPSWVRARGVGVGWDGSPSSSDAVRWAAAEAASRRCPLTVLHAAGGYAVWLDPAAHPDVPALVRELSSAGARAALVALEELRAAGATGATEVRVGRTTALISPQDHLLECSEDLDVLVIGNRGRGQLTAALLGSVCFAVSARSSCPVVVVHGDEPVRPGHSAPVVLGFDGSPGALAAARFAAAQAVRADAELEVVLVVAPGTEHGRGLQGTGTGLLRRLRADHPSLRASLHLRRGDPVRVLLDEGARAGLVVVGSRGRNRMAALVLGSTSTALVRSSRRPVAVVRGVAVR